MSATTYNAGVKARASINHGAGATAEGVKTTLRAVTDFARGLFGAEPSAPTKKVIARKTAARKPAAKPSAPTKKVVARKTAACKPAAKPAVAKK